MLRRVLNGPMRELLALRRSDTNITVSYVGECLMKRQWKFCT